MDTIIQLLQDYQEYSQQTGSKNLMFFGEWLRQKHAAEEHYLTDEPTVNEAGVNVMASYLLGGLSSYVDVWVKLTYEDLPLLSLGDFGIIKTVERLQRPSKKEIAEANVMERSTCMEAIKRMVKLGLLEESNDEQDRRRKRVSLSLQGRELVQTLDERMTRLGNLLMGNLSEVEKKSLIPVLKKLNDFHQQLYQQKHELDIKKMYDL